MLPSSLRVKIERAEIFSTPFIEKDAMTPLVQTTIYKTWLGLDEDNRTRIFGAFDELWDKHGNTAYEIKDDIELFHAGHIFSYSDLKDKPIFCSESKSEAESYLKFDGAIQRKISTFHTLRVCKFAYFGGSFIENGFADFLWSIGLKGSQADLLRSISAREWAAHKSIDGWYRNIGRGELLVFRPLQTLSLSSIGAMQR